MENTIGILLSTLTISKVIKEMLSGFADIIIFENVNEFFEWYSSNKLDILIIDRTFEDISAKEIIEKLEIQPLTILLTTDDFNKEKDGEFSFILRKPFNREELLEAITYTLKFEKRKIFKNKDILIVDDSEVSRNILKKYVKLFNYNPIEAINGKEALNYLKSNKENPPILVLTDQEMPEMDGMTLASEMRKIDTFNDMPIIMITGSSHSMELKEKAFSNGINDFILKPFNETTLKNALKKFLEIDLESSELIKIFLLDDSVSQKKAVSSILKHWGMNVYSTTNINKAKFLIKDNDFDIIFLDYRLHNNFTVIDFIKDINYEIESPIIVYTSIGNKEVKSKLNEFIDIGINDLIFTPFEMEEISFKIKIWKKQKDILKELKEKAKITNYDQLTEALSRPVFFERAEEYFSLARRNNITLSLLYLDIDNFKNINDKYGHKMGDSILKSFAKIVKYLKRNEDIFGRLGGEEFALLLPYTDLKGAIRLAERIRGYVEDYTFNKQPEIKITISIGVSVYNKKIKTFDELLNLADKMLYKAKNTGRNKVCFE